MRSLYQLIQLPNFCAGVGGQVFDYSPPPKRFHPKSFTQLHKKKNMFLTKCELVRQRYKFFHFDKTFWNLNNRAEIHQPHCYSFLSRSGFFISKVPVKDCDGRVVTLVNLTSEQQADLSIYIILFSFALYTIGAIHLKLLVQKFFNRKPVLGNVHLVVRVTGLLSFQTLAPH